METVKNVEAIEAFENYDIDETAFDSVNFPIKDRSKAARRKKTYFKGKNRYKWICDTRGYDLEGGNVHVIKGMLKKTNIITPQFDPDPLLSINLKNIRRGMDEKEMIQDYYEEAV